MTKVTYVKNGQKITEWVPTASLGIVTAAPALPAGDSCILDFIPQLSFGSIASEANAGESWIHLLISSFIGWVEPKWDCILFIKAHLAVATKL